MKPINLSLLIRWVIYLPILLAIAIVLGAINGINNTIEVAFEDITGEGISESISRI